MLPITPIGYKADAVGFEPTSYSFGDCRVTVTPDIYIVDAVGLEPTTFGLRDRYSNQLSYASIFMTLLVY